MAIEKNWPEQLKPCPFCGNTPAHGYTGDEDGGYAYVECHCGKNDLDEPSVFAGVHADTEAEAIRSWNSRK